MTDVFKVQRLLPVWVVETDDTVNPISDQCLFRYSTAMPWIVTLLFRDRDVTVEWNVDRETIAEGCEFEADDWHTRVKHFESGVEFTLAAWVDDGDRYLFHRDDVLDFLDETWKLVEAGSEGEFFVIPDDVIGSVETAGDY